MLRWQESYQQGSVHHFTTVHSKRESIPPVVSTQEVAMAGRCGILAVYYDMFCHYCPRGWSVTPPLCTACPVFPTPANANPFHLSCDTLLALAAKPVAVQTFHVVGPEPRRPNCKTSHSVLTKIRKLQSLRRLHREAAVKSGKRSCSMGQPFLSTKWYTALTSKIQIILLHISSTLPIQQLILISCS